jgi:uncharacterized repeat protein (TIGR01451 family)
MHVNLTRALLRNACYLALLFVFWAYGSARAESIVFTDTVPFTRTDWVETMNVPQFNPTLGILTSVEMTLTGEVSGTVGVENEENNPITVLVQEQATERIRLPDNTQLVAGGVVISQSVTLAGSDGILDFGGASGATFPVAAQINNSDRFLTPGTIAPFVGLGNVTLPVTATVAWTGSGSGNMLLRLRHLADSALVVRYVYVIPAIEIKKFTNGFDADNPNDPDVPQLQPGATVTWTYRVTNTGTITIPHASVLVTDSQPGVTPTLDTTSDVGGDNQLSPGEVWIFVATGVVQDLEAPTIPVTIVDGCNPGGSAAPGVRETYRNIGVVTVPGAQDDDPSHYCNPPTPGIVIKKYTNGFDADNPDDRDVPQLQPGAVVTWTYVVTNTGNITFAQATVVVTDSQPGVVPVLVTASDGNSDRLLSPGESWRYVATGTVQNLDTPATGTIVVDGCNPNDTQVPGNQATYFNLGRVTVPGANDDDPSHYCNPPTASINLEKTVYRGVNGGATCPGIEAVSDQANAPVTYCFEITNTGETYLNSLVFTDTILGINLSNLTLISGTTPLAPGARLLYYYQSQIPSSGGERINTAEVEANPTDDQGRDLPGLPNPTDQDTARVSPLPTGADPGQEPFHRLFMPLVVRR